MKVDNLQNSSVYLNRFFLKSLSNQDKIVKIYKPEFQSMADVEELEKAISRLCWKVGVPATRWQNFLITQQDLETTSGDNWTLIKQNDRQFNPNDRGMNKALTSLFKRYIQAKIEEQGKGDVENRRGGLLWENDKPIKRGENWSLHRGTFINTIVDEEGNLYLDIDIRYSLRTEKTLADWYAKHPDIEFKQVQNTYFSEGASGKITWELDEVTEINPREHILNGLGQSLAEYHLNSPKLKPQATPQDIEKGRVVFVIRPNKGGKRKNEKPTPHIDTRLAPIITLETIAILAEQGDFEAKAVFRQTKEVTDKRFQVSLKTAQRIGNHFFGVDNNDILPLAKQAVQQKPAILVAARQQVVKDARRSLNKGCFRANDITVGCLHLDVGAGASHVFPEAIDSVLTEVEKSSRVAITRKPAKTNFPEDPWKQQDFLDKVRRTGVDVLLVVTKKWLGDSQKSQLRKKFLEAGLATQFFIPTQESSAKFKAENVVLGLLSKAGWQTIALQDTESAESADLAIGFDAGDARGFRYGTCAFAVSASGHFLGWELPEAQRAETIPSQIIQSTVGRIVKGFENQEGRLPKRILLLRDGFVQDNEFVEILQSLQNKKIAVDLVEVRKNNVHRISVSKDGNYQAASVGTTTIFEEDDTFLLVTTQARAGGSPRPLKCVRVHGDTPLSELAKQIYHLSALHPASGFSSRLPMPLHFADKMAKEIGKFGEVGVLHALPRNRLFFV